MRLTAAPIGGAGSAEGYVIVAYDMTAQVRAQRTAETAEARFAEFLAAAPPLAFIKDQEGRYLFVNEHVPRLTGERQGLPWQGKTDYDLWPPDLAADIRENDGLTLAGSGPLEYVQVVPLDDGPHALLMYKFPLRGATGEPLLGAIGLDITDRVRAQARAQAEMERGQEREAHASMLAGERAVVAGALGRLRSSGTVETIGASIARLVLGLPGLDVAAVLLFERDGRATPVGLALESGPVPERRSVPIARSRALRKRCKRALGRDVEGTAGDPLNEAIRGLDIGVMGYAPISSGDDLMGILAVGAAGASGRTAVTERMPAIVEFAGLAGVLLGSSVNGQARISAGPQRDPGRGGRRRLPSRVPADRRAGRPNDGRLRGADAVPRPGRAGCPVRGGRGGRPGAGAGARDPRRGAACGGRAPAGPVPQHQRVAGLRARWRDPAGDPRGARPGRSCAR